MTSGLKGRLERLEADKQRLEVQRKKHGNGFDNWLSEAIAKLEGEIKATKEIIAGVEARVGELDEEASRNDLEFDYCPKCKSEELTRLLEGEKK